jgi:hypothetical protein
LCPMDMNAFDAAPKFNFGASTEMGAKMALPI